MKYDIISPINIEGQLEKLYFSSDVVSGEFIHTVTFDPRIPVKLINCEADDFLAWDGSIEEYDIRDEDHWEGEK